MDWGAWKAAVHGVTEGQTRLSDFTFTFHFHALKEMATHSSVLAWRIPGTGEPGGLPSMGLHRVGHNWRDLAAAAVVSWFAKSGPWISSISIIQKLLKSAYSLAWPRIHWIRTFFSQNPRWFVYIWKALVLGQLFTLGASSKPHFPVEVYPRLIAELSEKEKINT